MCAVALVFSPLAPLVPLAAAVIFWLSSFVYKYQLMFVFVTKVESGGVRNRILARDYGYSHLHITETLERRYQPASLDGRLHARFDGAECVLFQASWMG